MKYLGSVIKKKTEWCILAVVKKFKYLLKLRIEPIGNTIYDV